MKKLVLFSVALLCSVVIMAQSANGFSFQGYARGGDGAAIQNKADLKVKFSIYTNEGNPEFTEEQTLKTDEFGVFQAQIGTVKTTAFGQLNFATNTYMIKVEVMDNGQYFEVTKQQLLAVPYAKAAEVATRSVKADNGVPAGSIMPFGGVNIPDGWLLCDGSAYSATEYPELYAAIKDTWGTPGAGQFLVPDLRGQFLRGLDTRADGVDKGALNRWNKKGEMAPTVGSYQEGDFKGHNHGGGVHDHGITDPGHNHALRGQAVSLMTGWSGNGILSQSQGGMYDWSISGSATGITINQSAQTINTEGGAETRPVNAAVNYIIKK